MQQLENSYLIKIEGGAGISGTLINAFSRGITTLLELGRSLGNAIRRVTSNKVCPLK
jgi:hypothetical protein